MKTPKNDEKKQYRFQIIGGVIITRPHSRMYLSMYIFCFISNALTRKKKKAKETKEEKRISVENLTEDDNIV